LAHFNEIIKQKKFLIPRIKKGKKLFVYQFTKKIKPKQDKNRKDHKTQFVVFPGCAEIKVNQMH